MTGTFILLAKKDLHIQFSLKGYFEILFWGFESTMYNTILN
jgi:hypothetical protein